MSNAARIAVMGAGAGGLTAAADLSLAGNSVNLFELERFAGNLTAVKEKGGIEARGERINTGLAKVNLITTDAKEALSGVDYCFIIVPCYGHRIFAEECIPHLKDVKVVCYLGEGGGSLEFAKVARERGVHLQVVLGEMNTLPYTARIFAPGVINSSRKTGGAIAAALPSANNDTLARVVKGFWPYVGEGEDVFDTILMNFNAIDHVAPFVMNWGRLEGGEGDVLYWGDGATPSVTNVIDGVDGEITKLRSTWGLKDLTPYRDWLVRQGLLANPKPTTYEAIHASRLASITIKRSPNISQTRFITEDVPYALVLIASIGDLLGVETPTIDAMITLVCTATKTDYWSSGRTLAKLFPDLKNKDEFRKLLKG